MCLLSCGDQQPRVQRDLSFRDHLDKIYLRACASLLLHTKQFHLCFVYLFLFLFFVYSETDGRFRLTEDLLEAEREFLVNLRTIHDVYERPLRKLCSISDEEKRLLFGGVEPILSVSNMLLTKANNIQFNILSSSCWETSGSNCIYSSSEQRAAAAATLVAAVVLASGHQETSRLASSPIHTKCHLIFPPD